jgi:hypothetical protein
MNRNLLKKLLAAAITSSFLVSVGVSAAQKEPVCKPGCTTGEKCVTTSTKPRPHCVPK